MFKLFGLSLVSLALASSFALTGCMESAESTTTPTEPVAVEEMGAEEGAMKEEAAPAEEGAMKEEAAPAEEGHAGEHHG